MAKSTVTIKKKATGITYCTQPKIPKKKLLSHTPTMPHHPKLLSIIKIMMPKEATNCISFFMGIPRDTSAFREDLLPDFFPEDLPALRLLEEVFEAGDAPVRFRLPEALLFFFFTLLLSAIS